MSTDIFDTPQWPSDKPCLIVGSGPNLEMIEPLDASYYDLIITLNKAELHGSGEFWLCSAPGLLQEVWFGNRMRKYKWPRPICNIYGSPIFMQGPLTAAYPDVPFTFNDGGSITQESPVTFNVLKSGASVIGRAIQLAYLKGVKDIELAGIDMMGNEYFDGTINEKKGDGPWGSLGNLQMLIEWVGGHGCRVRSLTPTALTVEMVT